MEGIGETEKGIVADIVASIMTPGYTASGVIKAMFYAFYALFLTLVTMIFLTGGNGHVIALLMLAVCLFLAIRWFLAELDHIKRQSKSGITVKDDKQSTRKSKKSSKRSRKQTRK